MKKIPALDGLRGIAILLVFAYHYGKGGIFAHSAAARGLGFLCAFGWSGVDLFFVLSGFLITGILYETRDYPGYYKKFYARRALRIFPVYYLFAAIMFMTGVFVTGAHWRWGHLSFLFYVGYPVALIWPGLALGVLPLHITHLWSLAVEEQFYMIWPWMVARLRNPLMACLWAIPAALALRCAIVALGGSQDWCYDFIFCRMDALAVGAAIALLLRQGLKLEKWGGWIVGTAGSGVVAIFVWRGAGAVMATAGFSLVAFAYGGLLLFALAHEKLFALPVLRMFGKYSYGFYLFHFPLTELFEPLKMRLHFAYVPFCLLADLGLAAASFHLLEQPILRLKKYFSYGRGVEPLAFQREVSPHPKDGLQAEAGERLAG
jgi:peptidoglycan/LPS O-acetylase OafA/YrhL